MTRCLSFLVVLIGLFISHGELTAAANIVGRVTDINSGAPIAGATVSAYHAGQVRYSTTTDSNGNYQFLGIPPRGYTIVASASGYQAKSVGIKPSNNTTATVNLQLVSNGASVSGTITDSTTTNPINGATVNVYQGTTLIATTTTNGSGNYSVSNLLAPNSYTIVATASGYQTKSQGVILSVGGSATANIALDPDFGSLQGTVTDSITTNPIAGASIQVFQGPTLIAAVDTDGSGNYTISNLTPGIYTVKAGALLYQTKISGASIDSSSTTTLDFALVPVPGIIVGQVTDATTGTAIPGATVTVRQGGGIISTVLTDPNGQYEIDDLPPGSYSVSVTATGYQGKSAGAIVSSGQQTTENFALDPTPGTVNGTITDALTTDPIPGAVVQVVKNGLVIGSAVTNSSGAFQINNLPPGSFTFLAFASDYQTGSVGVQIASGSTTTVNLALNPNPGSITGTVTDSSTTNPINGALVLVYDGQTLKGSTVTDASGNYSFPNLPPGQYIVSFSATDYQSKNVGASVSSGLGTIVDVELTPNPGNIQGTITDAETSLPISGATIQVFSGNVLVTTVLTDSSGNYTINGVPPGSYSLIVSANNYQSNSVGAIVTSSTTTTADLSLTPFPGTITGTVTEQGTGDPIPNTAIIAINIQGVAATTLTDSNGNYTLQGLVEGEYILFAVAIDYEIGIGAGIVSPNSTTTIDFVLNADPGQISGTITDSITTNPIQGATVEVYDGQTLVATALTDGNGDYTVPGLAPGNYIVKASAPDYRSETVGAAVTANTTTTVDFDLDPFPGAITGVVTNANTGEPISGASINFYSGTTLIAGTLVTDTDGRYLLTGLPPGQYIVSGSAFNFGTGVVGVSVTSSTTTTGNLTLLPIPGYISGTVREAGTLNPIPNAVVTLSKGPLVIATAITDPSGFYAFNRIEVGTYTVTAVATDYHQVSTSTTVSSNLTSTVNFTLQLNPGTLTGTVTSSEVGNPVLPGATVTVYQAGQRITSTLTDVNGVYTIPNLAPGTYDVVVSSPNYRTAYTSETINASSTTTANYQLDPDPGAISGNVTERCEGAPVSGALILVTDGSVIVGFDVTDNLGNYSVPNLAPGTYEVIVLKSNFVIATQNGTVVSDTTTTVNFNLTPEALPPENVVGKLIKNHYLTKKEYVHAISWSASPGLCVTGYRLYRNGSLIAFIPANASLEYYDRCRSKKSDTYTLETVNSFGEVSTPVTITVG